LCFNENTRRISFKRSIKQIIRTLIYTKKYINIPQLIKTLDKKTEFPVLDCDGVCYVFIAVIIRVEILDDIRYY
jgi:hypothetical protein